MQDNDDAFQSAVDSFAADCAAKEAVRQERMGEKKRKTPERDLQIAAVGWLRLALPGYKIIYVKNEGTGDVKLRSLLKKMGQDPGCSDLILLGPNRFVAFLEAKAGYNKQSPDQLSFESFVTTAGFHYCVFYDLEFLYSKFLGWGLKPLCKPPLVYKNAGKQTKQNIWMEAQKP